MSDAAPLIRGVNAAFVGVADPQPSIKFYCGLLGFEIAESGVIPAGVAEALWGSGIGAMPVTVLTAADAVHGRIVLLTVGGTHEPEYPHTADLGLAGIDVYTRDIVQSHRELTAAGHTWAAPPTTWEVPFGDQIVTVTEGICLAPDGTDVVFVEPVNPRGTGAWEVDPNRHHTELTSVVCHVPDFDAELAFWGAGGLGLDVWYDTIFGSEGLEAMADLAPGTRMRLAFLAGARTARIELTRIENRTGGVDRRGRQRTAQSLGHCGWLVLTPDLDAVLTRVADRRGRVLAGPIAGSAALFGSRRVASVDTPNRIPVTLLETPRVSPRCRPVE